MLSSHRPNGALIPLDESAPVIGDLEAGMLSGREKTPECECGMTFPTYTTILLIMI